MIIKKIQDEKKNILVFSLVILISILLKHFPFYTGFVVFFSVILLNRKNFLSKSISVLLIAILSAEIFYFICFHQRITQAILDSIVETNHIEFSKMLMSKKILFIVLASFVISICIGFSRNFTGNFSKGGKFKKIVFVALFSLLATDVFRIAFKDRVISDIREDNKTLGRMFYDKYPLVIGDSVYLIMSVLSNDRYRTYNHHLTNNYSIIGHDNKSPDNIIVIMGESASANRFSVYGYPLNTTPYMKKIFMQKGGCIIGNVHSSAPITRDSIAMSFSFAIPENEQPLFKEKNIIDLAKAAGYKTYWLSSQEVSGLHASKFGYIAKKSDSIKLTKGNDDKLSNLLKTALQDQSKKFIVIHMAGSHGPYTNFDNIDKAALPHGDKYDLTIHHTDRIINDINNIIKSKLNNYILFYTSDHGEIVNVGHGLRGAKEQYFIPLMIFDNTEQSACKYIESLRNQKGYISGLMNKYIFAKIMGYKLSDTAIESEKKHDRILDANNNILLFDEIETYY